MTVTVRVDDVGDPRLADYVALRDVQLRTSFEARHGLFLAEGEKVVRRAVAAGYEPRSFLMAPRWVEALADVLDAAGDVPCYVASEQVIESVTGFHVHRGALASLHRRALPDLDTVLAGARTAAGLEDSVDHTDVRSEVAASEPRTCGPPRSRIAVLEDFVDHANVGAAFRNAAALGIGAVLLSPRCADPLYRRAVKVSMGAVLQIPWTRVENWPAGLSELQQNGYVLAGMTLAEDAITLDELVAQNHAKLALVFGTEGHGLTARTSAAVDIRVRIPMAGGIDSLNVAASSAVAFYAIR